MAPGSSEETIAAALVEARRSQTALARFPGKAPQDLASAYRVQDLALALWNRPVGGWKVGRIGPDHAGRLGATRLAGPVFADTIIDTLADQHSQAASAIGRAVPAMPIFADGFAAAEAEFMCRLGECAGAPLPRTDAETLALIDEVRIGIEIASSPYPGVNADGPLVTIADHGNNRGLVLGPAVAEAHRLTFDEVLVTTFVNAQPVGQATTATMLDGPLGAVRFLLANLAERGLAAQPGWWISSGAITGVHQVRPGDRVVARFDGLGEVACTIATTP